MFFPRLSVLAALAGLASAHFQLTYPPSRGFIEDNEPQEPCGGFNTVTTRTPFSLGDSFITLVSEHETPTILVLITFDQNPTDIKNFTTTPSGAEQPPLRDFFQATGGNICIGVDIKSVGYTQAQNGTNATIAVQYDGGDGTLYQCADVVLLTSSTPPSNVTCSNEYSTTAIGSGTGSAASPTASHGAADRFAVGFGTILANVLGLGMYLM